MSHCVVSSSTPGHRKFIVRPPEWADYVYVRSRQFYERKRNGRRPNVLFAMMRSGELYRDIPTAQETAAA